MFVTFYAYKGGVGRTLALANIACLLAEDKDHPQKVLLWDFDLEAPGLHKLFRANDPHRDGFVDLAYGYAQTGKMGNVKDCIYASDVDGVHVLPAGRVGGAYCEKLQKIDWPGFFTTNPSDSGPFFGPLLESIAALKYDYVLIDSRTGLNDQAGICTEVLPDLIVTLFRLTDQNLDGLTHVVPAIRSELKHRGKDKVTILPLASPVPSSSSKGIRKNRERATKIFGGESLSYIRFDPDLVAEEKLFCLESVGSQSWPVPFIVDDYRKLSETIRNENPNDTRTAMQRLEVEMMEEDSATAWTILRPLLERRPRLPALWKALARFVDSPNVKTDEVDRLVDSIIKSDEENAFAFQWRATQCVRKADSPDSESLDKASEHLELAIRYSPDSASLYRELAHVRSCKGDLDGALGALKESRKLARGNLRTLLDLAQLNIRRGAKYFALAADLVEEAPEDVSEEKYLLLAYLHGFLGNDDKAADAFARYEKHADAWQWKQLCLAHLRLAQRRVDEATLAAERALSNSDEPPSRQDQLNWGEFFICARAFDRATELLERVSRQRRKKTDDTTALLKLTEYIAPSSSRATEEEVLKAWKGKWTWNFRELLLSRERMKTDRDEEEKELAERFDIIEILIRRQQLSLTSHRAGGAAYVGSW